MIRNHGAVQAYIKIPLRDFGCTRMAATGMLSSMTMHFKNHKKRISFSVCINSDRHIKKGFRVLGVPLAMLCFLGAASGGVWLLASILVQDSRRSRNPRVNKIS